MKWLWVIPPQVELDPALATLWQITASQHQMGDTLTLGMPGWGKATRRLPAAVTQVLYTGDAPASTDKVLPWLRQQINILRPDVLLFYGSVSGQEWAVRFAARSRFPCYTQVSALEAGRAIRSCCSSYLQWESRLTYPCVLSTARGGFQLGYPQCTDAVPWTKVPMLSVQSNFIRAQTQLEAAVKNPLEGAKRLVVAGRGLGKRESCEKLRQFAQLYQFTVGYSRPAATNGWGPLESVVGQSGTLTAPELCITFGVSGAAAFLAGVKQAKQIIVVNTDPDAPIFRHCDIGVLADAEAVLDALISKRKKEGM